MLNVVVVGAGTMGTVHAEAYQRMTQARLVAVVDIREDVGTALADRYGARHYLRLEDALLQEDVQVVDVCVPTHLHRGYVEQAARAKKHVICEKPIALTAEDANAMMEVCAREGVRLLIGHVVRFFPEYQRAHHLVQSGAVGPVGTVRTFRGGAFPIAWNDWYASADKSGTLITDLCIHDFDFLRWTFGEVARVYAKSLWKQAFNRMDHALVSLRFSSGVIAHVEGTWAAPSGFRTAFEIAGTGGIIQHASDEATSIHTDLRASESGTTGVAVPESPLVKSPYQVELEHFIDCLITGHTPLVTAEDAYEALRISLAALQSVQTGEPVFLREGLQ